MDLPSVGIIGVGFVGGALYRGFNLYADVKAYDVDPKRSLDSLEEVCKCRFVFLCLPSPMASADGGRANTDNIENICSVISDLLDEDTVVVLKSTVPIGTTCYLQSEYDLPLIHNPEFLTARAADRDFISNPRIILGGDEDLVAPVEALYRRRFSGANIITMSSDESEAVKYIANCFFCVKVMFFNEIFLGLRTHKLDWAKVMAGVMSDGRIGDSHNQVPGHDGKFGFGGACFPKDISSLIEQLKDADFDPLMLEACWEQNKRIRPEKDWWREI